MSFSKGFHLLSLLFVLALVLLCGACSSKEERKLNEKQLESLLVDLYTTQGLLERAYPNADDTTRLAVQNAILNKYKLKPNELDSIIAYYSHYKAERLSIVAARASEKIMAEKELFSIRTGIDKDYFANIFKGDYTLEGIAGIVPENYFPRYARLSPEGDSEVFTGIIIDTIPKGSRFVVHLEVRGLPVDTIAYHLEAYPQLVASYTTQAGFQVEQSISIKGGREHTLSLLFAEKTMPGRFTVALYFPSGKAPITLFVSALGIEYSLIPILECNTPRKEVLPSNSHHLTDTLDKADERPELPNS